MARLIVEGVGIVFSIAFPDFVFLVALISRDLTRGDSTAAPVSASKEYGSGDSTAAPISASKEYGLPQRFLQFVTPVFMKNVIFTSLMDFLLRH